jgi:hypothetical protein
VNSEIKLRAVQFARRAWHYLANSKKLAKEPEGSEKAGEMIWGAAVMAVKAVGAARGRKITKYQAVDKYVRGLAEEFGDKNISTSFWAFKSLHGAFYELDLDPEVLADLTVKAEDWIAFLFRRVGLPQEVA